jgi:hypothetical protein
MDGKTLTCDEEMQIANISSEQESSLEQSKPKLGIGICPQNEFGGGGVQKVLGLRRVPDPLNLCQPPLEYSSQGFFSKFSHIEPLEFWLQK